MERKARRSAVIAAAFMVTTGFSAMLTTPASGVHPHIGAPNDPVVPAHQHYVVTPDGRVPIGPNACKAGMSLGFDHFHLNVHRGVPGQNGTVVATGCPTG